MRADATNEGLDGLGTSAWRELGINGTGVTVAIIDVGFDGYSGMLGNELPSSVTTIDHCSGNFSAPPPIGSEHGAAVAEVVHQVAPGAHLLLICIDSEVGLAQAERDAITANAKVINESVT